jgi:hypothetical protein
MISSILLHAATRRPIGFDLLIATFFIAQRQIFLILSDLGANPSPARPGATHRRVSHELAHRLGRDGADEAAFPGVAGGNAAARFVGSSSEYKIEVVPSKSLVLRRVIPCGGGPVIPLL